MKNCTPGNQAPNEELERLLAAIPEALWSAELCPGHPLRFRYLSSGIAAVCGEPVATLLTSPKRWMSNIHPEDRERYEAALARVAGGSAERQDIEYRIRLGTGELRWVRNNFRGSRTGRGEVLVDGVLSDISTRKAAETTLRESERRFRDLAALSSDWYWHQDADLRFTYLSAEVSDLAGYTAESSIGKARWELTNMTPLSCSWAEHRAALEARQPFRDFEYARPDEQGRPRYISASGVPIFDEQGCFAGYEGIGRNITDRKLIEKELRGRQELLELAQSVGNAVAFELQIESGVLRLWTPELEGLHGIAPGTYDGTLAGWKALVWQEDWPSVAEAMERSRETGEISCEYRVKEQGGQVRWLQVKGRLFSDPNQLPVRIVGFALDVSDRKRVEAALRASDERYQLAVAGSTDGLWDWNILTNEMFLSERTQILYGLVPGKTVRPRSEWRSMVVIHPDDVERQLRLVEDYLAGGPVYDGEWRVRHQDGVYRWVRIRGMCVRDEAGIATRLAGSATDVDPRRRAEAALLRSQRLEATGILAGGIAHDFNNILAVIMGYGEMALRDAPAGSRLRHALESIMVAGDRGRLLVERILAFSRSGVGQRLPVHVESVVREAMDFIGETLPAGITVQYRSDIGAAAVLGDPTQVHQVVMNLATNAVQAMPGGGAVAVSLQARELKKPHNLTTGTVAPGPYVVLTVTDTGSGIAPELIDRIFDPFFTTKDTGNGTGLGLSLVHGIVADGGGGVDVESSVNNGSTFTVYMPRHDDALLDSPADEARPTRGEHQQVLVVDDEPELVSLMTDTLSELGYMPIGFTSSEEALEAFRAYPDRFDAVITDERMPGLTGSSLAAEIRVRRPSLPIILVSGYAGSAVEGRAGSAGVNEILKKPLRAHELALALARVLAAATPAEAM